MPAIVKIAVLLMFAAFTFYSVGVWAGVLTRRLRPWHAGCFWGGFLFDTAGTGAAALLLMLAHAIWATWVLIRGEERTLRGFHQFSITVWSLWLIRFVTGLILGGRRAR